MYQVWVEETIGYSSDGDDELNTNRYWYDEVEYLTYDEARNKADYYSEIYDNETMGGYPRHCFFYITDGLGSIIQRI